jgi:pimeloyl-ACP methyl ester carboxylesterase
VASRILLAAAAAVGLAVGGLALASTAVDEPQSIAFPTEDSGMICGIVYGKSPRAVVLVHGGLYRKEGWDSQAHSLVAAGFMALAIDLRGFGCSTGPGQADSYTAPLYLDVLAAVRYLRANGAQAVSVIGASAGGWAAADATALAKAGEISHLVLLGAGAGNQPPERIVGPKLLIISREDRSGDGLRLPGVERAFEKMPKPKRLLIVSGSAHAQAMFGTSVGGQVTREMIRFLSSP